MSSQGKLCIMKAPGPIWRPALADNQMPELPPAHELENRAVLKACIEARAALAKLKQAAELTPNQAMLINTIALLEAKDSSEIENIVTTTDQLIQYAHGPDNADPATKEALRYRTALHRGCESLKDRPLCTTTAVEVCRTLKGVAIDIRRTPGTQLADDRTVEVVYTLPEGEARLRDMLANWERYLNEQSELDPLVRMAVGHYQFEAIHPFADGNGRTGRVINILYLIQEALLTLTEPALRAVAMPIRRTALRSCRRGGGWVRRQSSRHGPEG
jgi:Fic family protein